MTTTRIVSALVEGEFPNGIPMGKFLPFYERIANRIPGYIVGRVVVSGLLGLAFLGAHYLSIVSQIFGGGRFNDWSWFLAVLISTATLCLYYATHTLRAMFPEMDSRLQPVGNEVYMGPLTHTLSDSKFIFAGIFFGLLNCGFGYAFGLPSFGLPYSEGLARLTTLGGYFLAGFVCGMAVWGIYGVWVAINALSAKAKDSDSFFDFTSPDRCGGTLFLGDAFIKFGLITLIVGVMISVYIFKTQWTRRNDWWVISLMTFWIVFPYVASLVALIGPAVPINRLLREYKTKKEADLKKRLADIQKALENQSGSPGDRKDLREQYEFEQKRRNDLHNMRTWPFGPAADLKYLFTAGTTSFVHWFLRR